MERSKGPPGRMIRRLAGVVVTILLLAAGVPKGPAGALDAGETSGLEAHESQSLGDVDLPFLDDDDVDLPFLDDDAEDLPFLDDDAEDLPFLDGDHEDHDEDDDGEDDDD